MSLNVHSKLLQKFENISRSSKDLILLIQEYEQNGKRKNRTSS